MVRAGVLDLNPWVPRVYPLAEVNAALADIRDERPGGFINFVVAPDR
jgi:hypothetical protein